MQNDQNEVHELQPEPETALTPFITKSEGITSQMVIDKMAELKNLFSLYKLSQPKAKIHIAIQL